MKNLVNKIIALNKLISLLGLLPVSTAHTAQQIEPTSRNFNDVTELD